MTAINKVIANKEFSLISKINIKNILLGLQRRAQSSFNSRLFFVADLLENQTLKFSLSS